MLEVNCRVLRTKTYSENSHLQTLLWLSWQKHIEGLDPTGKVSHQRCGGKQLSLWSADYYDVVRFFQTSIFCHPLVQPHRHCLSHMTPSHRSAHQHLDNTHNYYYYYYNYFRFLLNRPIFPEMPQVRPSSPKANFFGTIVVGFLLDVWQCPGWRPPLGWIRTPVLFFAICGPK